MTYESRPVFTWEPLWSGGAIKPLQYDLRELSLGYGAPTLNPIAPHIVRVWEFSVLLKDAPEAYAWEQFWDAAQGRLKGFWFPEPAAAGLVVSGTGSTVVLEGSNLVAGDRIWISRPIGNPICRQITAIAETLSQQTLTLDSALPADLDRHCRARLLLYARFASDEDKATSSGEGIGRHKVRVVELPKEYAAAESGRRPVVLYRFVMDADGDLVEWHYTSHLDAIVTGETTWTPAAIEHGSIRRAAKADREDVTVTAVMATGTPWSRLFPRTLGRPLWLEICEVDLSNLASATVVFVGRLRKPTIEGRKVTMPFASFLDALSPQIPTAEIAPSCNHCLYSAACGVSRAAHRVTATISALSGTQLTITAAGLAGKPAHWYAGGYIDAGDLGTLETRTVRGSSAADGDDVVIHIDSAFAFATVGSEVRIHPGCDLTPATCDAKFDNFINFGGFGYVTQTNLALRGIEYDTTGGQKK
jgi:uncharacterized phage protein (TIGR02218 family)